MHIILQNNSGAKVQRIFDICKFFLPKVKRNKKKSVNMFAYIKKKL